MDTSTLVLTVVTTLGVALALYAFVANTGFAILTFLAAVDYRSYMRRVDFAAYDETFTDDFAPGISVLMPAYNEAAGIVDAVRATMALRYPDFEIVVVDDGSTDDTVSRLVDAFDLAPVPLLTGEDLPVNGRVRNTYLSRMGSHNIVLVAKDNGGKADALNVGVNVARKPLVCMVDADSILEPDALLHVSRPFADDPENVVASGGVVRLANGCTITDGQVTETRMPRRWLPRIQVVEYLRAFMIGRSGWSRIGGLLIISGTFGLFRRDLVIEVGGMATDCIGEDAELVVRIHRWLGDHQAPGKVVFVSEPVAWTEAPETLPVLSRQRARWHRGLLEILVRHRGMLLRRRYGMVGMVALPWFVLFELLAPLVELASLVYVIVCGAAAGAHQVGWLDERIVDPSAVGLLLFASIVYSTLLTFAALLLEELSFRRYRGVPDLLRAFRGAIEENLGYRQMCSWWRLRGAVAAVRGNAHQWGDMERRGVSDVG
jgi:cellulose synthase/poly-beta-1,6-N-acetylglucosamine synthase-like glycosyltransferase